MPERSDANDAPQVGDTFTPTSGAVYPADPGTYGDISWSSFGEGGYPEAGFQCPENIETATNSFTPPG